MYVSYVSILIYTHTFTFLVVIEKNCHLIRKHTRRIQSAFHVSVYMSKATFEALNLTLAVGENWNQCHPWDI